MMNQTKNQLELTLEKPTTRPASTRRQRSLQRAHWWFQQMHGEVDRAVEWTKNPTVGSISPTLPFAQNG
jgi:hypothetical protein